MHKPEIVHLLHDYLGRHRFGDRYLAELYTDVHPLLLPDATLQPFQRVTLRMDGCSVHPDLAGRFDDGTTCAVIVEDRERLLGGLARALVYRDGFHQVFLAFAALPPDDLLRLAQQQHIGLLCVTGTAVYILYTPPVHAPHSDHARSVAEQFASAEAFAKNSYPFTLPTHYLAVVAALRECGVAASDELEATLRAVYPVLPQGHEAFGGALRGATRLGLVEVRDDMAALTQRGCLAASLLPDLATLFSVHTFLVQTACATPLAAVNPTAGAVLRWALWEDPVVQLLVSTLITLGPGPHTMTNLVRAALTRDYALALLVCFAPEYITAITDARGAIAWERVQQHHVRRATYLQYKSLLKHAGLLVPHPLGCVKGTSYDPQEDVWEMCSVALRDKHLAMDP